jgi:hypothetical protein
MESWFSHLDRMICLNWLEFRALGHYSLVQIGDRLCYQRT